MLIAIFPSSQMEMDLFVAILNLVVAQFIFPNVTALKDGKALLKTLHERVVYHLVHIFTGCTFNVFYS